MSDEEVHEGIPSERLRPVLQFHFVDVSLARAIFQICTLLLGTTGMRMDVPILFAWFLLSAMRPRKLRLDLRAVGQLVRCYRSRGRPGRLVGQHH